MDDILNFSDNLNIVSWHLTRKKISLFLFYQVNQKSLRAKVKLILCYHGKKWKNYTKKSEEYAFLFWQRIHNIWHH